ncbi:response regulator [Tellurirhabdus bombi]|uniref:response regulator n=1 Tax=Tellurirhabdus bombi TaxID=2907205 RepID=UPI001F27C768|nr:response regulator [Tellurirhabdus bombi]
MDSPNFEKHRIYLADDDVDDSYLFQAVIQEHFPGVAFTSFPSGDALLAALQTTDSLPTLIFLDYWMPLQTGLETFQELKKQPQLASIPVVLLTGQVQALSAESMEEQGIWRIYNKPTSLAELRQLIDQTLGVK